MKRSHNVTFAVHDNWACSKLTILLDETLNFQMCFKQTHLREAFVVQKLRNFYSTKALHNFSIKNNTALDFLSIVRLKSSTYNFVNLTIL